MYVYEKTLLYACKNIKEAIKENEKIIKYSALSSKFSNASCEKLAEKILIYVDEKSKLIELKNLLRDIVKNFSPEEKKLFACKYLGKKLTFNEFSKRQYYRNQQKLLKNFSSTLKIFNLDEKTFMDKYKNIPYIKLIYDYVKYKDSPYNNRAKKTA